MLRYLFIATAIVFVIGGIAAEIHRGGADLRITSVPSTGSPSPPRSQRASTFAPGAVTGDAPWAFDALVDCFHHERTFHGTLQAVRRHVPSDAQRLGAGDALESGPCTAFLATDTARICRGPCTHAGVDVRVPPHVAVYARGTRLIYVVRWTSHDDARVDRLATMSNARILVRAAKGGES